MAWYGWLALALGAWGVVSLVVAFAAGRVIAYAASEGMAALEVPTAKPTATHEPSIATLPAGAH